MLNQHAVDIPTLPVNLRLSAPHPIPGGMLSRSLGMLSRRGGPPSIWDTQGFSSKVFCRSNCVLHSTFSTGIESMEFRKRRPASLIQWKRVKGEHKIKIRDASLDRQPKIQSSSVEETLERIMVQTDNDCRFRISISTNSLHQQPLLAGR